VVFSLSLSRVIPSANSGTIAGPAKKITTKLLKNNTNEEIPKKCDVWRKKGLRATAPIRKYPFTGGAEMH